MRWNASTRLDFLAPSAFFFFLFVFAVLAPFSSALALTYDEIIQQGSIRIAVYKDFAPFSSRIGGKLVGVDVDIAKKIAEKMNVKLSFYELVADETADDDLRNAVWKGHYLGGGVADVMLHVPYDREFAIRNNLAVLFGPYYEEKNVVASDPGKVSAETGMAVFRYEKISVELDTMADFYLLSVFGGQLRKNVVHFFTVEKAVDALKRKEVAAVMAPRSQIEAVLREKRRLFEIGVMPAPGLINETWLVGAAIKHTNRQLGYAVGDILSGMIADGTMKKIFSAHGLSYAPPPTSLIGDPGQ
jgi:ABC-type amino acid transport substrate-binding protein